MSNSSTPPFADGLSVWFMPEDDSHRQLENLQQDLLNELDIPEDDPTVCSLLHVTGLPLMTRRVDAWQDFADIIERNCDTMVAPHVTFHGIGSAQAYTLALYLTGLSTEQWRQRVHRLNVNLNEELPLDFFPHISLLYGNIPRQDLVCAWEHLAQLWLPPQRIKFTRLALVSAKGYPNDWHVLREWTLRGA